MYRIAMKVSVLSEWVEQIRETEVIHRYTNLMKCTSFVLTLTVRVYCPLAALRKLSEMRFIRLHVHL